MDPVTVTTVIDRPREEVFAYLADVANHPEFADHLLTDYRLTREDSWGAGAGARFRLRTRLNRFGWCDLTVVTFEPPRRMVLVGRTGKYNRTRVLAEVVLEPASGGGSTEAAMTVETQPGILSDRLLEALGARPWVRRRTKRALRRLRSILEEGRDRGAPATIAGGPRKPATRTRAGTA